MKRSQEVAKSTTFVDKSFKMPKKSDCNIFQQSQKNNQLLHSFSQYSDAKNLFFATIIGNNTDMNLINEIDEDTFCKENVNDKGGNLHVIHDTMKIQQSQHE